MKNTKSLFVYILLLAGLMTATFQGCKKYPEGPNFSTISRKERVSNTWKVENYKINGNDYTNLVSDYQETFTNKASFSYSWGVLSGSGSWSFQNWDKEIQLTGTDAQSSRKLIIQKLEENAFWYYYMDGNDKYEVHLITK